MVQNKLLLESKFTQDGKTHTRIRLSARPRVWWRALFPDLLFLIVELLFACGSQFAPLKL